LAGRSIGRIVVLDGSCQNRSRSNAVWAIEASVTEVDRLTALTSAQERMDLEAEFESMAAGDDLDDWARGFIEVAANYGELRLLRV
jgi:hypothetical protein